MGPYMKEPSDFVLVCTETSKGCELIFEVAALRPEIAFVCIVGPQVAEEAESIAAVRGLTNVRMDEAGSDVASLCRAARVVAIPGFDSPESFNRVRIEAGRLGKPVMGSKVAQVSPSRPVQDMPVPDIAAAWAFELARLYAEEGHCATQRTTPLDRPRNEAPAGRRAILQDVVRHAHAPVLVGVGSGIGNMIHVSPMIRRLVRHLGAPVDLLVVEDHSDSLFLLHNRDYVNAVYSTRQYALERRYDTAFLTHCFGPARLPINAERVVWSRDWSFFHPDHPLHEALFNLEAARRLLGVDYAAEDASDPYVGNFRYRWPAGNLVGFHGGSKHGIWVSKRWPYHRELASVLKEKGYRVASFGTPEEYVEGTEDMTGGTIEEMAERMLACSYFVSNDSGVMNIANALGIPLLAIFGPTNARTRGPLRATSQSLSLLKDCAPCEYKNSAYFLSGQCRCLRELSLERVFEAFERLVAAARPGASSGG